MDKIAIEKAVFALHTRIWRQRIALSIDAGSPIAMLDPSIGAAALGVRYVVQDTLGSFGNGRERFSVAGLIDRRQNHIQVSAEFSETTRRFTGAHELGHFLLHKGEMMHRDRPVIGASGFKTRRDVLEREADYFAACYLMPPKLVFQAFAARFGSRQPFDIDDAAAYYLRPDDQESVFTASSDELAMILVAATRYGGKQFQKLNDEFLVSPSAMAIRLTELGLVA